MFVKKQGKTKVMYFPIAASVAIGKGAAVALASGTLVAALNDVAVYNVVGILVNARATTDTDYGVAKTVAVEVPVEKNVTWIADINSTLVTSDVGLYLDFCTGDTGLSLDHGVTTLDHALVVQFISTTQGVVVLNCGADAHTKAN